MSDTITVSDATASPMVVKVGEAEYRLSPLTFGDYGEIEQWVRAKILSMARESLEGCSDSTLRREVLDQAFSRACRFNFLESASPDAKPEAASVLNSLLSSIDGSVRLTWLSLRQKHPELTEAKTGELMRDPRFDASSVLAMLTRKAANAKSAVEGGASKKKKAAKS